MFFLHNEPKIITWVRCIVLAVFGIILVSFGVVNLVRISSKPIDLGKTHKDWNQLTAGTHVEMDIDILIGAYVTTSRDGVETSRDYLMPHLAYDSHNDIYTIDRVIGVKVNSSSFNTADTIVNNTESWWLDRSDTVEYNTVTIHVDGYLQKMNGTQLGYYREAMEAAGFTPHDIAAMTVPYYISDNGSTGMVMLICGIVVLLSAGGLGLYAYKKQPV